MDFVVIILYFDFPILSYLQDIVSTKLIIIFLLFRKHSSGDLHSRLKTRKLLGVGETDDGDVHRSKVGGGLINTFRPRQNGRHFTDDIFRYIFMNEKLCISIKISLKFVPTDLINDYPVLI